MNREIAECEIECKREHAKQNSRRADGEQFSEKILKNTIAQLTERGERQDSKQGDKKGVIADTFPVLCEKEALFSQEEKVACCGDDIADSQSDKIRVRAAKFGQ